MSYKALYLTYRPQRFEEVAGQKAIVRTLKNAISKDKIGHAYLFAGPRGTGKTSMARLFAKALNCEQGLGCQCNECINCTSITEGTHPDIVEIDAASNNGVDQVRELIEKVRYAPLRGKYKVYIIDEVHMMSTGAFNALLKTLEEPPENVIFILCTTEPHKVLPTILSRCQRFDFSRISDLEMKEKLMEVLATEGASYDNEGLKTVVSLADGGMRDAYSIIDQILAYSGNTITNDDVLTIYGLTSVDEKISLLKAIAEGDVKTVVSKSETYLTAGIDVRRLLRELIGILKDLLIYERTKLADLLEDIDEEEAKDLEASIRPSLCNTMVSSLIEAQNNLKNINDVRSLFELSLLRMASSNVHDEIEEKPTPKKAAPAPVIEEPEPVVEVKESEPAVEVKKPEPVIVEEVKPVVQEPVVEEKPAPAPIDTSRVGTPAIATEGEMTQLSAEDVIKVMVLANKNERVELVKNWERLNSLKDDPNLGNLATLLSEGHPFCLCQECLILAYNFSKLSKKANIIANQKPMQDMVETLLGRRVFIYAIDPNEKNGIIRDFMSKQQIGLLPDKKDITLDFIK
ncbi:MAG: DNA polymerase III subunit gamma/tau [Bacilli bacterium]|nr:DNA polymerase III subunit gamma/tau [Bacilli bacterium]